MTGDAETAAADEEVVRAQLEHLGPWRSQVGVEALARLVARHYAAEERLAKRRPITDEEWQRYYPSPEILCGHWTYMRLVGEPNFPVRCDLDADHVGMHKGWWSPGTNESFSWAPSVERHDRVGADESSGGTPTTAKRSSPTSAPDSKARG